MRSGNIQDNKTFSEREREWRNLSEGEREKDWIFTMRFRELERDRIFPRTRERDRIFPRERDSESNYNAFHVRERESNDNKSFSHIITSNEDERSYAAVLKSTRKSIRKLAPSKKCPSQQKFRSRNSKTIDTRKIMHMPHVIQEIFLGKTVIRNQFTFKRSKSVHFAANLTTTHLFPRYLYRHTNAYLN